MEFRDAHTVSEKVHGQVDQVCRVWLKHLKHRLVGVYLHGSLALGSFVEDASDLDILVVTEARLSRRERLSIARDVLAIDQKPCPLEISALWLQQIFPWQYPTPCQFHYSSLWTEHYRRLLGGEIQNSFLVEEDFTDTDMACHVRLAGQSGLCVYVRPIHEVFPPVPEQDFWDSISRDIGGCSFEDPQPKTYAANILTLARVLSYKKEKRILSKVDGARWALGYVPEKLRYLLENAVQIWYAGAEKCGYDAEDVRELQRFLMDEIRN